VIARFVLHVEAHRGYRPRVSFRRAPRPGDRVVDGGVPGTLVRCRECGEGFLHQPDDGVRRPRPAPAGWTPCSSTECSAAMCASVCPGRPAPGAAVDVAKDAAFGLRGVCPSRGAGDHPAVRCPACIAEAVVAGLAAEGLLRDAPRVPRPVDVATDPARC
jgi:hypothetical protein